MRSLILLSLLCFTLGCAKDGKQGPEGPQGEQGPKGDQGLTGANGSSILSGNSAPTISQGKSGDLFLNLTTGDLYGPKTLESWGSPFNLKGQNGQDGQQGIPGATILSGQIPPITAIGKNGDFYIDLKEMTIYGPKTSSGWGDPVSLKSDVENGVSVYLLKPDWNKNIVSVKKGEYNWTFSTFSDEYTIPGNVNNIYHVGYAAVSTTYNGLSSNISINNWIEFSGNLYQKYATFPVIEIGVDVPLTDIKVENIFVSSNSNSSKYKFNISGESEGQVISGKFRANTVWILIKSYKFEELKVQGKTEKVNRYLRLTSK
ncbi:hypothetical protein [Sphingobacterium faecium]|uniref:hypothetical protein n=1 Tax=Sphingobacterium faecium TaxID=34087 RepID=UPI0032079945